MRIPLILLSAAIAAAPLDGLWAQDRKTADMVRTEIAPVIDGRLDEPAWARAAPLVGMRQMQPVENAPPEQPTEIRVMYDDDNLYIGGWLGDKDPDAIVRTQLVQGQGVFDDDHIQILLDPLDSGRRGYIFYVNANGVQRDGLVWGRMGYNMNWDGIWYADAAVDSSGWTAEIAIPFRTLSFDPSIEDWGLTISRSVMRTGEQIGWEFRDGNVRNDAYGLLRGFKGLKEGIGLDVIPSLVARDSRSFGPARSEFELEPSLDVFYRFTPSLVGALTINTDFSATEVDTRQVNLTRFSLFFPEKRDFFLQDADIFEFGDLQQNGRPFFSRTIGLSGTGQPVDLVGGAKLTGRIGRWNVGVLGVQQDSSGDVDAESVFVGRLQANVLENSTLGVIATSGDPRNGTDNSVLGADFNFTSAKILEGLLVEAGLWYLKSDAEGLIGDDAAWGGRFSLPNDRLELDISFAEIQKNFSPAMGFVNRTDIRQYEAEVNHRIRFRDGPLRALRYGAGMSQVTDLDGRLQSSTLTVMPFEIEWPATDKFSAHLISRKEILDAPFFILPGVEIPAGQYDFNRARLRFETAGFRKLVPVVSIETGDFYDGRRTDYTVELDWRPGRHLTVEAAYSANDIELPGGDFVARIMSLRTNVAFNVRWSWVTTLQYDNISERLGINSRLQFIPRLGQSLFLVLDHDLDWENTDSLVSRQRDLTAKINYTFRY